MVNKGSRSANFVRFRPHTYARISQSLPPLWATKIKTFNHKRLYDFYRTLKKAVLKKF